jgi:hypothetical protein
MKILDELEQYTSDDEDPWGDRHAQLAQKALPALIRVARAAERYANSPFTKKEENEIWAALQQLRDMGGVSEGNTTEGRGG